MVVDLRCEKKSCRVLVFVMVRLVWIAEEFRAKSGGFIYLDSPLLVAIGRQSDFTFLPAMVSPSTEVAATE